MTALVVIVPGRLDQLTGGYLFDRRIVEGLRGRGRRVRVLELDGQEPAAAIAALPDDATVVVDGLALPALEGALAAAALRLRLVAFVHHALAEETGLAAAAARRLAGIEAALLPLCRGVLCPSRHTAAAVAAYRVSPDRIAIVPPGTAPASPPPAPRCGPVRRLLCVAGVIPRKGHRDLIDGLARLRELDWSLLCLGSLERDPAQAESLRRAIAAAGLATRVTLAGECPPAAVAAAYRAANAFVLASRHEGYGMAYAEAMAYGLPLIATRAGAVPETVPEAAALFVPPGDPAALAAALRRLITDPALACRLAAGSRAAGAALPDWPQAVTGWEAALERLAALDPPAGALAVGNRMA